MLWLRTLKLGIKSLLLHPMRSLLTVLGIFIGVAAVIWLLAISEGISKEAQKKIEGLGANNIIVRSVKPPSEKTSGNGGPVPYGVTREDLWRITTTIPTITNAVPIREVRSQFTYDGRSLDGRLVGCTPDYDEAMHLKVARGRFIEDMDLKMKEPFCVVAAEVAESLFPGRDPIGREIYLSQSNDFFEVIGVLHPRTATAAIGGSLDAQVFYFFIYMAKS